MVSSNLAASSLPKSLEIRKMNTPFHAGHTGNLVYFSIRDIVLFVFELFIVSISNALGDWDGFVDDDNLVLLRNVWCLCWFDDGVIHANENT